MVSSGRRDPPNGFPPASIGLTENFISDGRGERVSPSPVTQTGLEITGYPLAHPLESLSFVPRVCKVAAEIAETTGSGFPWKSATAEFTNPTGLRAAPRWRLPRPVSVVASASGR